MGDRRLMWANFDVLLGDMAAGRQQFADFFGFEAPAERLREIARGPLMSRYSKALEYAYSPALRREVIEQELRLQCADIDHAVSALETAAKQSPLLASALARSRSKPPS